MNTLVFVSDPEFWILWSVFVGKTKCTLEFQINVLDQISVLVGKNVKFNKRTGPNKCTGGKVKKILHPNLKYYFQRHVCVSIRPLVRSVSED